MSSYKVGQIKAQNYTYYYLYREEDEKLSLLPSKYLVYKTKTNHSPNTVRRIAFSLLYYMRYLAEKGMDFDTVLKLSFVQQQNFFLDYLNWLKEGKKRKETTV